MEEHVIDVTESEVRTKIAFGEALERLLTNADFKTVILDGYLKDEAVRLVHLKCEHALQEPIQQAAIDRGITAISEFRQYLSTQRFLTKQAQHLLDTQHAEEVARDNAAASADADTNSYME